MKMSSVMKKDQTPQSEPAPSLSLRDRFWIFWNRHNRQILFSIGILLALGAVFGLGNFYRSFLQHRIEDQFLQVLDRPEAMSVFASRYPHSPLGGLTHYMLANTEMQNQRPIMAGDLYGKAADGLGTIPIGSVARFCQGCCLLRAQQASAAEDVFRALAADPKVLKTIRAGSFYQLALIYSDRSEWAQAFHSLEALELVDPQSFWVEKSRLLRIQFARSQQLAGPQK